MADNNTVEEWHGTEPENDTVRRSQVYLATHDGAGNRLPYMNRSFISFSYDGKFIEDFGFIATADRDFLQRKLYADFEDNVTDSKVWDGQIYWSSHYKSNAISFTLSTDGVLENELEAFKAHFSPGKIGELILAEHPNRAIMARVAGDTPQLTMIPFEEKISLSMGEDSNTGNDLIYNTSTTKYKGTINITFVMDEPFWYARANMLLDKQNNQETIFPVTLNGEDISNEEALKITFEDGIPLQHRKNTDERCLYGMDTIYTVDSSYTSTGSRVGTATTQAGKVAYQLGSTNGGITINASTPCYFYYPGTAPGRPTISFTITPIINNTGDNSAINGYISFPANNYDKANSGKSYNQLIIDGKRGKHIFCFTTPSIYTAYNQVIEIFHKSKFVGGGWEDVREEIRDNVKHYSPRQYANYLINQYYGTTTKVTAAALKNLINRMTNFFKNYASTPAIQPAQFIINSEVGQAVGYFTFRQVDSGSNLIQIKENVGDMVRSDYLVIDETNVLTAQYGVGSIDAAVWTAADNYTCRLSIDEGALNNFKIQYKIKYL